MQRPRLARLADDFVCQYLQLPNYAVMDKNNQIRKHAYLHYKELSVFLFNLELINLSILHLGRNSTLS